MSGIVDVMVNKIQIKSLILQVRKTEPQEGRGLKSLTTEVLRIQEHGGHSPYCYLSFFELKASLPWNLNLAL